MTSSSDKEDFICEQKKKTVRNFRTFTVYLFSDGDWDFYWCDREWLHANYDTMFLQEHQKILHFRNHYEASLSYSCADPEG